MKKKNYKSDLQNLHSTIIQGNPIQDVARELFPDSKWKSAGQNLITLCPFHQESNPSFHISIPLQIFKCFGCNKGGDMVRLVQLAKNISKIEALKHLARQIKLSLPNDLKAKLEEDAEIQGVMNFLRQYFKDCLNKDEAKNVRQYLQERQIENWEKLPVGFYPSAKNIILALSRQGFSKDLIKKCQILAHPDWNNSLVFVYHRNFTDVSRFKLRHPFGPSNDTLFIGNKERDIGFFGLDLYNLKNEERITVTEGEFDVLAVQNLFLREYGKTTNVICRSGKAFRNLHSIGITTAYLLPDNDRGGITFVETILKDPKLNVTILELPDGVKDPDDLVKKVKSVDEFREKISKNQYLPHQWVAKNILQKYDLSIPVDKQKAREEAIVYAQIIKDKIHLSDFIQETSSKLGVEPFLLLQEISERQISRKSQLQEKDNEYYLGDKRLSSFIITPKIRIYLPTGEKLKADITTNRNRTFRDIIFPREAWHSKAKFLKALPSVDMVWFGQDIHVQYLLEHVGLYDVPEKYGTELLGLNEDKWVIPQGVITRNGWEKDPSIMYVPTGSTLSDKIKGYS